ncbi:ABC transporter substrate-binding protein [Streptacidiphilus sp. P02-A3a]|uniref:ABC transporter substrate-binding protein n=1 Tax=Streptacidiphilus sp. P02-A3a TaxID=2704468 RepID=UPI0015FD7AFF|nr:extracellular solute-binding protein [Streptacidiphilus sp. P02-A3a]QMU70171.1 extracellular solute-binding protein [Streptacidiphilus sp. P02-A3a]QMU70379.1 extracellular solute-binding protein [Streptacidiphilus sp. P02-A3a]
MTGTTPLTGRAVSRRGLLAGFGVLGTLGALSLAGCATSAPGGSAKGAATDTESINFYGNALGEDAQKAAWQAVIDGWQRQTGKKIKPVVFPYDQASTQLALAAKTGDFDGVGQGPWQVLVPTGILADVSDLAATMDLPGTSVDSFRINGKLYFIPINASGIGLVCDGRIADEVGLSDSMTVEDFATALEKIKKQDPKVIPYAAVTENPDLKDAVHWMWGWGSPVVTDSLRCTIGDAPSVAAITWYKGLQDAGLTKAGVNRSDARILFAQGQTAMYDDAPLADSFVRTNGGSAALQAAIRPLRRPAYRTVPSANRFWGSGLFCSAGEGEQTSKDFINYVATNVSAATALYQESSLAPADAKVAAQVPGLNKDAFQSAFRTAVADHSRASAWDALASSAEIDTAIGQGVAGILAGQSGVQSGLNALRKTVQGILAQNS